jgi:lipopolysaccharide/colanic/teichoic acid biosynthesis glycosyltransferase
VHLANLGFFRKNVMLVGSYDERIPVEQLFQNINNTKNFIGQIIIKDGEWYYKRDLDAEPTRITKTISNFLFSKAVNELIICMDTDITSAALQECADWCYENSIGYYLIPDIAKLPHAFPWGKRFAIIPSIERYCPNRDSLIMISFKRIFDIVASAGALVVLSPVFLVLSILIRLGDGGTVFYVSKRVGIHGKLMNFYKFRSMVPNAEELKKDLLDRNERPDGPLFKLTNDPRVTKVGRFLRKSSLDELPQFWNVLKGDMSIIGPRPQLPHEVAEYGDEDNLRLECIPGISCLPQIYGRNTLGFRDWINLDLEYRKNWSLTYDFLILFKTAKVVLKPVFAHFSR